MFFKNDEVVAVKRIEEFDSFKEKYEGLTKYGLKTVGKALENPEEFDEDELYGIMVTLLKKSMDLSDSAMELVRWQCEKLESIDERLEKIEKKKEK